MKFYQVVHQIGPFADRRDHHIAFYKYQQAAEDRARGLTGGGYLGGDAVVFGCRDGHFAIRDDLLRLAIPVDPNIVIPRLSPRPSAAHGMARALLEMSCRWDSEWCMWSCQCCGASGGTYREDGVPPSPEPFEHHENCALDAALRNAGLR